MIERILGFSLCNRILVALLTAAIAGIGIYSLKGLAIDAVPDITNNQVQINTVAAAFSPMEVEKQVTFPVETALAGIPGLESTRSLSRNGFSQVTAIFSDDVDIYFARNQVNQRLAEAKENLPDGVDPTMGAISTGLGEIYMWTVEYNNPNGKGADIKNGEPGWQKDGSYLTPEGQRLRKDFELAGYLRTVEDWIIRPQMKGVKGVAGVDAIGGYVQQYHVMPDPEKLVSLGLSFDTVINVIQRNNHSIGAGYIERNGESYVVRSDGRIDNAEQLANIVVANRRGIPIYLKDVAEIGIGRELRTGSASGNGNEVVVGTSLMLIGSNSRVVSEAVDQKLQEINKSLPPGIIAKTVLNRTKLVDSTIKTVEKNLTEGAILVIVILFALLGNFRAALITALVIPISMLMTAMGMQYFNISGNLMSLGALDFGLIVDGAVIITENCLRRLAEQQHHEGRVLTLKERLHEVSLAAREMIQPSVFGQAIIIMVYIPLLTFTGVEGKMFQPMALTVIIALVAAFVLSLTFVPAMIAIFVSGKVEEKESKIIHVTKSGYEPMLRSSLHRPLAFILGATGAFAVALIIFFNMGQEFIPTLDEKDIAMHAIRIPSTSLTQSQALQAEVEKAVSSIPEVSFVFSKTGTAEMAADPMPPNASDTFIILKPREEWADSKMEKTALIDRIAETVGKIPGNNYEFTQPIQMRFNELISGVRSDIAIKVYGDDFPQMEKTANQIAQILRGVNGSADVKVEQTSGLPMMEMKLDKGAIARYGLNVSDILDVISVAIGGKETGLVFQGDRRFDILVRLPDALRQDLEVIQNLPILLPEDNDPSDLVRNAQHVRPTYIPLKEVAKLEIKDGPNQISRENGKRRIVVQSNVRGRDISSFVEDARTVLDQKLKLPTGYWLEWGGQFKNLEEAKVRLSLVVPACFFMIFLLLFSALNSVKQALLVFSGVPLALTGGILTLWLRGMPFSISAAVGLIALSGVAVLNGLVMVSRINQLIREGMEIDSAIIEGALSRLRPVLMTALVASLGFVPMAIATGAGAEVQKPLATVVIGGLITATLLTLLVLPAIYHYFSLGERNK
ncbi:efflux RND transporter permease subunit [Mucilaginibacter pedocola]|uniref:Cation transporter n=1 Tax=Mucilaginibacter pedocola TaxID=1792845 RepID=A0A1S9P960_9SPHI|nr:CusA/CzcA family heavy metal efflux RND transporter [Mucilaginibacter pedocola]OOQ57367.1 cation transporter [Mucilaginibacter pedocola]